MHVYLCFEVHESLKVLSEYNLCRGYICLYKQATYTALIVYTLNYLHVISKTVACVITLNIQSIILRKFNCIFKSGCKHGVIIC